tara:strand:- start:8956 stop:9369 length:414 start_codon:yes stop_codon:yes gene_type:complete
MRKSLHLGDERRLPVAFVAVEKNTFIAEEVFNPEASLTDGNPFPEEEVVEETTPLEEEGPTDYNSLTVDELRALCRAQDLPVTGKKAELVARLMEADTPSEEAVEVTEDVPSEEATSSDENGSVSNESEPETTNTVG